MRWVRSGEAAGSLPGAEPRLPPLVARSNLGRAAGELDCPGEARDPTSTVVQSRDCGRDTHYWAPTGSPEAVARLRFPQNVDCGFPALRSSEDDSQHCASL